MQDWTPLIKQIESQVPKIENKKVLKKVDSSGIAQTNRSQLFQIKANGGEMSQSSD